MPSEGSALMFCCYHRDILTNFEQEAPFPPSVLGPNEQRRGSGSLSPANGLGAFPSAGTRAEGIIAGPWHLNALTS